MVTGVSGIGGGVSRLFMRGFADFVTVCRGDRWMATPKEGTEGWLPLKGGPKISESPKGVAEEDSTAMTLIPSQNSGEYSGSKSSSGNSSHAPSTSAKCTQSMR